MVGPNGEVTMNSSVLAAIGGGSDQLLAGGLTPGSGPEQARLESRKLLDCTKLTFPKGLNLQENPTMDQDNPSSSGSGDPFDSLMEQFLVAEEDLPENWRHPSSAAALNVVDCPVPAQTAAAPYTGENTPMHDQEPVLEGTPTVVLDIPNNNSADIVKPVPAGINKDGVEPAIKTVKTKKRKRKGDENAKKPLKTKSRNISKKDSKKSSKKAPRKVLKGNKGSAAHAEMVQQQLTNLKLKGYECTEQELHKIKLQLAQDRHNERHTLLGRRTPTPKNNAKMDLKLVKRLFDGTISPIFSASLQQIGPDEKQYCFGCAHHGHLWRTPFCPLERLDEFFTFHSAGKSPARYGSGLNMLFRKLQFRSDIIFVFDGYVTAMRDLMDDHKPNRDTRQRGAELMAGGLSRIFKLNAKTFPHFEANAELDILDMMPLIRVTVQRLKSEYRSDTMQMIMAERARSLPIAPSKELKIRLPMGVYKDLKTEIIGNRATARCTGCLYMGHAANATRHCPFALLKKSYEKACKGLPKTRWLTEKDKGNVNKDKVVWILNEIRRLRIPAHPQDVTRLEDLITNWHALDDKTGKPQHLNLKGAALKIAVAQKKKEDAKMKQKENAASKLSSKGDIQLPDVKPVYPSEIKYLDTSRWVHGSSIISQFATYCTLPKIGQRKNILCRECLYFAHDYRSVKCPVLLLRKMFQDPTEENIKKALHAPQQLRDSYVFWAGFDKDVLYRENININGVKTLFEKYLKFKSDFEKIPTMAEEGSPESEDANIIEPDLDSGWRDGSNMDSFNFNLSNPNINLDFSAAGIINISGKVNKPAPINIQAANTLKPPLSGIMANRRMVGSVSPALHHSQQAVQQQGAIMAMPGTPAHMTHPSTGLTAGLDGFAINAPMTTPLLPEFAEINPAGLPPTVLMQLVKYMLPENQQISHNLRVDTGKMPHELINKCLPYFASNTQPGGQSLVPGGGYSPVHPQMLQQQPVMMPPPTPDQMGMPMMGNFGGMYPPLHPQQYMPQQQQHPQFRQIPQADFIQEQDPHFQQNMFPFGPNDWHPDFVPDMSLEPGFQGQQQQVHYQYDQQQAQQERQQQ